MPSSPNPVLGLPSEALSDINCPLTRPEHDGGRRARRRPPNRRATRRKRSGSRPAMNCHFSAGRCIQREDLAIGRTTIHGVADHQGTSSDGRGGSGIAGGLEMISPGLLEVGHLSFVICDQRRIAMAPGVAAVVRPIVVADGECGRGDKCQRGNGYGGCRRQFPHGIIAPTADRRAWGEPCNPPVNPPDACPPTQYPEQHAFDLGIRVVGVRVALHPDECSRRLTARNGMLVGPYLRHGLVHAAPFTALGVSGITLVASTWTSGFLAHVIL